MVFKLITNSMAILSLTSSAIEAGQRGFKKASSSARTELASKDIKDINADLMLNKPSEKHNAMKEYVRQGDFTSGFYKAKGALSGFFKGTYEGMKGNFLSAGFAILTLASKNKTIKTIGAIGCGLSGAWDFIKNGTNLLSGEDTIEK